MNFLGAHLASTNGRQKRGRHQAFSFRPVILREATLKTGALRVQPNQQIGLAQGSDSIGEKRNETGEGHLNMVLESRTCGGRKSGVEHENADTLGDPFEWEEHLASREETPI